MWPMVLAIFEAPRRVQSKSKALAGWILWLSNPNPHPPALQPAHFKLPPSVPPITKSNPIPTCHQHAYPSRAAVEHWATAGHHRIRIHPLLSNNNSCSFNSCQQFATTPLPKSSIKTSQYPYTLTSQHPSIQLHPNHSQLNRNPKLSRVMHLIWNQQSGRVRGTRRGDGYPSYPRGHGVRFRTAKHLNFLSSARPPASPYFIYFFAWLGVQRGVFVSKKLILLFFFFIFYFNSYYYCNISFVSICQLWKDIRIIFLTKLFFWLYI